MAQGVVVDVSARITGYEQSLARLREALNKLDPGSSLARSLNKGLAAAENQIKSLGKNLTPKFTNDAQLDRFVDKFNNIGNIIQDVSQKMQGVSSQDLSFEGADESVRQLITRLNELQTELDSNISKGIQNTITNTQELSKVFSNLDIDIKDKNPGEIFDILAEKADESAVKVETATRDLAKAQENLAKKQAVLSKAENSPINNKEALQNELQQLTSSYTQALNSIKQQVTSGLTSMLGADNPQTDKIAAAFLGGLTPENLRDRLKQLKDSVAIELKDGLKAKDIYVKLFGDMGQGGNAQAVNTTIISKMFPNMSELKAQFDQKINEISTDLTKNQVGIIKELISESDIQAALERTLRAVDGAYHKIQGAIAQGQQEVSQATAVRDTAQNNLKVAQSEADQITRTISTLTRELETVKEENKNLRNEIEQLKQNIEGNKAAKAEEVKNLASSAARGAEQWRITTDAANQYSAAIEKVHQREQLVGKIEGVVQRWFSIYAAVRMVGNAIRSIISTIKELDKTITDITIVTNMSREDLWGQMPQYTQMAQDYAVSIAGVYQVSQLFYQQGLQTNDVMVLTGETLKMARIAGLDYAEATNYMTNALRSFKLEMDEASRVTDAYSVLAANAAVSVSEIAEAMSKTASSAYAVGASLENTAAMITVMTEATRESASNIGSALKSIISRYGEMTSDPAKLVDSEGEEMSLNKVDRALQSVGITLQDTQGQFRAFDDVIMELASVWDTLDANTQRYIATIMAGNRQQSRFLALVSSYDRYAELSEKAADAAGAGQEQFEKTLQGIEARTQQLQTSLQNLYTSAGLEQLYGQLLGIGSNILEYYNNISAAFGSGIQGAISAVANFGAQFYNLANVVVTVVKLIKTHYINSQKELTVLTQAEEELRQNGKLSSETQAALQTVKIWKNAYKEITNAAKQEAENASQAQVNAASKAASKAVQRSKIGNAVYGLGTAGSLVGTMLGGQAGNIVSSASGAIGAIGAFASHNWLGGIMSLISAGTSFISLLSGANEVVNKYTESLERNQKAQEEYGKAQQKSAQSKALVTTIENEIDKLNELSIAQYDSTESKQAYLEQVNKLADAYPELIDHYTDEGNAILISKEQLQEYIELKKEQRRLDREDELRKRLDVNYEDIAAAERVEKYTIETKADTDEAIKTAYENALYDIVHEGQITAAENQDSFRVFSFIDKNLYPILSQLQEFSANLREATGYFGDADARSIYGISGTLDHDRDANRLDYWSPYTGTYYADEDAWEALVLESIKNAETAGTSIVAAFDEAIIRAVGEENYVKSRSIYRSVLIALEAEQAKEGKISENKDVREQIAKDWIENSGIYTTSLEKIAASASLSGGFENYLTDKQKQYGAQFKEHPISEFWDEYLQQWQYDTTEYYGRASKEEIEKLNNAFDNLEDYSLNRIRQLYDPLEQSQATQKLTSEFNTQLDSIRDNFDKAAKIKVNDQQVNAFTAEQQKTIDAWFDNYSLNFLRIITSTLPAIRNASNENREFVTNQWIEFYDSLSNLNEKDLFTVGRNIQKYDLTSISGIFAVIDEISNIQGTEAAQEKLKVLAEYIVPNFIVEFDSMTDVLTSNFEQLAKAISDAQKGMNLSDAIKMADTLGVSITEFQQVGNQYYYTDYMALVDRYLGSQEEIAKYLFGQFDVNTDKKDELEAYERAVAARNQYYNYAREAYLAEGRIADFLSSFAGDRDIDVDEVAIRAMLAASEIPEGLEEYSTQLIQWYQSLGDDVYKAFMDSLSSGEATEIKVTSSNKGLLEQYENFVQGEIVEGQSVFVNLAQATAQELNDFYNQILLDGDISSKERNSYLKTLDDEIKGRNRANIFKEVVNSYESFDRELAKRYAESLDVNLNQLNLTFDETNRTFSISLAQMREQLAELQRQGIDPQTYAELQDAIQAAYKTVADLIVSGLKGTLTQVQAADLFKQAEALGIKLDFTATNQGLRISTNSAIQLYSKLVDIDSIASKIVFDSLKDSLTQSGEACEDMLHTMASIARIEREIARSAGDTNKELKDRAKLYKQIAYEQMFDSSNYDFMGKALPGGLQAPFTFWDNLASMRSTLSEAAENGYVGYQDYWNMLNYMHTMAEQTGKTFTLFGQKITSDWSTVSAAWEKGTENFVANGDKTVIGLEGFGVDFAAGADGMVGNIDSGIDEFAQSQIKMLDALIHFLDSIIAMEDLEGELSKLSGDGGIFDFSDLFSENGEFAEGATDILEKYKDQLNQIKMVLESGKTVGFGDWLLDSSNYEHTEESLQSIYAFMQRIFELNKNNQLTPENIYSELANLEGLPGISMKFVDSNGEEINLKDNLEPKQQEILIKLTAETSEGFDSSIGFLTELFNTGEFNNQSGTINFGDNKVVNFSTTIDSEGKIHLNLGGEDYTFDPKNGAISFSEWLQDAFSYYQKGLTADLQSAGDQISNTETEPVNIQSDNSNINISITYTNEQQTAGFVKIGDKKVDFGPNSAIPTAGAALQKAAYDYDQEYGGGTLQDISLAGKTITVVSANGVTYNFSVDPGVADIGAIKEQWETVQSNINTFIAAIDKPESAGFTFDIDTTKPNWEIEVTSTNVTGTKTVKYNFKVQSQTLTNKISLQNQWQQVKTNIAQLTELASKMPENIIVNAEDDGEGGYSVKIDATDVTGTKNIKYGFDINSDISQNQVSLTAKWVQVANDIATLRRNAQNMPRIFNKLGVKENDEGSYTIEFEDVDIGGESTITYAVQIGDVNEGLSTTEFANACVTAKTNIEEYKDAYADLMSAAGIKKFGILQYNDGSLQLSADIQVGDGVSITWTSATITGDAAEVISGIAAAKDDLKAWQEKVAEYNIAVQDILSTNPNPIEVDNSIHLIIKDDKIYVDNGLAKGTYDTLDAAMSAITGDNYAPSHGAHGYTESYKPTSTTVAPEHDATLKGNIDKATTVTENIQSSVENIETVVEQERKKKQGTELAPKTNDELQEIHSEWQTFSNNILTQFEEAYYTLYPNNYEKTQESAQAESEKTQQAVANFEVLKEIGKAAGILANYEPVNVGENNDAVAQAILATGVIDNIQGGTEANIAIQEAIDALSKSEDTNSQAAADILSGILSQEDSSVVKLATLVSKTRLPYTPAQFRQALDGISIHGDFWGGGNQYVTSDGKGGNIHLSTSAIQAAINAAIRGNGTAKGNFALAKGTLMGELGPELYVTGGRYYVAGQNGAEFVNLPSDAIVFNHLQTKRLLGTGAAGRGKPITNEKRATSYAKGNINGGPAMASAKEVRNQLVAIRDIWTSLLNKNFSDLVETAGAGGGGGGGSEDVKNYLYDLDRWYNLLRQISKAEEQITYQQKLRENMRHGDEYVRSLEYELALLEKQASNYQLLSDLQKSYYDARRRDQEQSIYRYFFTYDNEGLMQYEDEGFKLLAGLNRTDTTGQAVYTSQQQIDAIVSALTSAGYSKDLIDTTLYYNEAGERVEDAADIIQNFYDKFDGWIDEMDSIYDSYNEYQTNVQELLTDQNKILEEYRDLQLSLENQLLAAIEEREQAIIDKLQDESDALRDASDKYLNGLTDALNKERELYQQNQNDTELMQMQRQLAVLQRSGGSASAIQSLQEQINSRLQDRYFDTQQSEIDAIKDASDKQLEMMQQQIDLMTETLEYQKENGMFWEEVTQMMHEWNPHELTEFVSQYSPEFLAASITEQDKILSENLMEFEKWYEHFNNYRTFNDFYDQIDMNTLSTYGIDIDDQNALNRARATAKVAYQKYIAENVHGGESSESLSEIYRQAEAASLNALKTDSSLHKGQASEIDSILDNITVTTNPNATTANKPSNGDYVWYWNKNSNSERYALRGWADENKAAGTYVFSSSQGSLENYKKNPNGAGVNADAFTASVVMPGIGLVTATGSSYAEAKENLKRKLATLGSYDAGGLNDYTGPAMLHGTKTRPEAVLNAEQTHALKTEILGNSNKSLLSLLLDFNEMLDNFVASENYNTINHDSPIVIENASVNMNVNSIANDYDARRAGESALEEMLRIARKTGAQSIRR